MTGAPLRQSNETRYRLNRKGETMNKYDYLTPGQAARILGVSTDTVGRYLEAGVIEGHRTPGGHARLLRASVEAVRRHPAGRNVTVLRSVQEA